MKRKIKVQEVKRLLCCSTKTVDNYVARGLLHVEMPNSRLRYFDEDEVLDLINAKHEKVAPRKTVAYYRVSTQSQKKEMEYQRESIENWAIGAGKIIDEYLYDIGSGLNFKRKNFLKIIDMIEKHEIKELIVTYKDRLTRFAFELIEERCKVTGTELTVINLEKSSPEKEVVDDLMEIIHVFSCRLYGLRKYKIKKEDLLEKDDSFSQDENVPDSYSGDTPS